MTLLYKGKLYLYDICAGSCLYICVQLICIHKASYTALCYNSLLISCRSQLPEDFESLGKFKTLPKNINIGDLLPTSTPPPTTPIPLGEVSTGTTTQEMSDYWQHIYHELET